MIGLIVDGEGDFSAFKSRYSGYRAKVLKADGPRGHTVSEQSIVASAKKQISILRLFRCAKIAIVTDFEAREGGAGDFCRRVEEEASRHDFSKDVKVFSPDKMLENWLLADIAELSLKKTYLKKLVRQRSFESLHGKSELKKLFIHGCDYNEIKHGAELFPLVRADAASKYSPSFARYYEEFESGIMAV
jgi:hypothetical protein